MNRTIHRLFAGVAAVGIALAGLATGAATANADVPTAPTASGTITVNASDATGHTLTAYKIAAYNSSGYQSLSQSGNGTTNDLDLDTFQYVIDANDLTAINTALSAAGITTNGVDGLKELTKDSSGAPYGYTSGTATAASAERKFADSLASQIKHQPQTWKPSLSKTLTANTATAVSEGLYLVLDSYDGFANTNSTQSVPIIVGSTLASSGVNPLGSHDLSLGTINLKNTTSVVTKQVTNASGKADRSPDYNIGDTVYFTLTTKIPNYDGYASDPTLQDSTKTRLLSLTDTFQSGSFRDQTIDSVYLGSIDPANELTSGTDYDIDHSGLNDNPPTLTVDLKKLVNGYSGAKTTWKSGDTITVLVQAKLASGATTTDGHSEAGTVSAAEGSDEYGTDSNGNYNKVTLKYSNTPSDNSQENKVPGDTVNVYSFKFTIKKTDASGSTLPGAQFTIQDEHGNYYTFDGTTWNTKSEKPTALGAIDPSTSSIPDKSAYGIFISDANGTIAVKGLKAGTYTITEIKAPAGYLDLTLPSYSVTIGADYTQDDHNQAAGSSAGDNWLSRLDYTYGLPATGLVATDKSTATVENITSITQLPKTGAAGIALFSIVGLMLVAAAAVFGIRSRKASRQA